MKNSEVKIKTYVIVLVLLIFMVISCDFVLESDLNNDETQNKNISVYMDEAKFLVEISILNLLIINLSKIETKEEFSPEVKAMADNLKNEHKKIHECLDKIAKDKFISIPRNIVDARIEEIRHINQSIDSKRYLTKVSKFLKNQIKIFDQLRNRTVDIDFRTLSINTVVVAEKRLKEVERLLKKL